MSNDELRRSFKQKQLYCPQMTKQTICKPFKTLHNLPFSFYPDGLQPIDKAEGGLYAALTLPTLVIGTVGGGSGLPTQKESLQMMGCHGTVSSMTHSFNKTAIRLQAGKVLGKAYHVAREETNVNPYLALYLTHSIKTSRNHRRHTGAH